MHTLMVQMLKEVAGGRAGSGKEDALMAAILAKVGQPDPLVLKLLDTHGKREELNDFFNLKNAVGIKLPPRRRKDAKEKQEFEQNAYDLCLHQTGESWLCCKSFALLASLREKLSLLRFLGSRSKPRACAWRQRSRPTPSSR